MGDILHLPTDRDLNERVRRLIWLRWLVLTIATVISLIGNRGLGLVLPTTWLWGTLVAIAVYNGIFWFAANSLTGLGASHATQVRFASIQIITDLVALTLVLHATGGIENPFSLYYVLLVVTGSVLTTRRAAYLYAGVATALWVGLLVLEATGAIPHYNLSGFSLPIRHRQLSHILAESLALATANFCLAYISSRIVEQFRAGQRQLVEANSSCELRAGKLARLNIRLKEMDRARSLFIRLVTHELRAPVAGIQSYLQLILEGYVPEDRIMEILSKSERRARDQLELIGDLLEIARLEEPTLEDPVEPCDAAALLRDVVDMMQARIQERGIAFAMDVAPDLPLLLVKQEHLKQVWVNLISNAIKYTPEGGKVWVTLHAKGRVARGSVRDTGIGISPEEKENIFENFYRAEAAKNMARDGTGLGLSIVKGITDRYDGRVWVESEQGVGSTFSFEFPVAPSQ